MIEKILFALLLGAVGMLGVTTHLTHQHVVLLNESRGALVEETAQLRELLTSVEDRAAEYDCFVRQGEWHPEFGCALELLD